MQTNQFMWKGMILAGLVLVMLWLAALRLRVLETAAHSSVKPEQRLEEPITVSIVELTTPVPPAAPEPETVKMPQAPSPINAANEGRSQSTRGAAIAISADYRRTLGFAAYAEAIQQAGGVFYIYDGQKIRSQLRLPEERFEPVNQALLARMSPRMREVSDLALEDCLERARDVVGPGYHTVILLIPARLDARIQEEAEAALRRGSGKSAEVSRMLAHYNVVGSALQLTFTAAVLRTGTTIPVSGVVQF